MPARSYPITILGEPALADIAPGARKNSMDRSDNSQPPGDGSPTEKTQPTAPAPSSGQEATAPPRFARPDGFDAEPQDDVAAPAPGPEQEPGPKLGQQEAPKPEQHEAPEQEVPTGPALSAPSSRPLAADAPVWAHGHPHPLAHRLDVDRLTDIAVRAAKVVAIVFCAWFAVALLLIAVFRFVNPPLSALMVLKFIGGTSIDRQWVPMERISPNLVRAVITSEDDRFCDHWGIDYDAIAAALRRSSKGTPRGASTISMQVAKNMFLWPAKSYVRKVLEVPLTYAIELMWPKWRILEVYLNIAEWGPGVFGAEAAAQLHFDRPARRLSTHQAALLAVSLPNPHVRVAGRPGAWTSRRASVIQRRASRSPEAAACVLGDR